MWRNLQFKPAPQYLVQMDYVHVNYLLYITLADKY